MFIEKGSGVRQYWVAEASGDLLAAVPNLAVPPPRKQIEMRIGALLDHYAGGNISKLARLLGVNIQALWGYLHKGKVRHLEIRSAKSTCMLKEDTNIKWNRSTIEFEKWLLSLSHLMPCFSLNI